MRTRRALPGAVVSCLDHLDPESSLPSLALPGAAELLVEGAQARQGVQQRALWTLLGTGNPEIRDLENPR